MSLNGSKFWKKLTAAGLGDRDFGLDGKCRLQIEALGIRKRRSGTGISNEIPVQPGPVETQRIGHKYGPSCSGDTFDPLERFRHHSFRRTTFAAQPGAIQSIDLQRFRFVFVGYWLQFSLKGFIK